MSTYKGKGLHLVVLSIGAGAMFIASFTSHPQPDLANAVEK
jgi:hypothetical protein